MSFFSGYNEKHICLKVTFYFVKTLKSLNGFWKFSLILLLGAFKEVTQEFHIRREIFRYGHP